MSAVLFKILIIVGILILLGFLTPISRIEGLIQRAMLIIHGFFNYLIDGFRAGMQWGNRKFHNAADSLGLTGPHFIQRIVGMILFPVICTITLIADVLLAIETLAGYFGSDMSLSSGYLPLETLAAISIVGSIIVWGLLFWDVKQKTHLTIFSSNNMSKLMKNVVIGFCIFGFITALALFSSLGYLRIIALQESDKLEQEINALENGVNITQTPARDGDVPLNEIAEPENELNKNIQMSALTIIMVGFPFISALTVFFSAKTYLPLLGMAMILPIYLVMTIPFGLSIILFSLINRLIDLIYNFCIELVNFFAEMGARIRLALNFRPIIAEQQSASNAENESDNDVNSNNHFNENNPNTQSYDVERVPNQIADNSKTNHEPELSQNHTQDIYEKDDPNWNPLQKGME